MHSSHSIFRVIVCLAALPGALLAQTQTAVLLPGAQSAAASIPVLMTEPLLQQSTISGVPTGAFQVISKTDGTKYYIISAAAGGVTVVSGTFSLPRQVAGISGTPVKADISPDGRVLVVISGNTIYFVDTFTDGIRSTAAANGTPVDLAFSHDSSRAFVLSNGLSGGAQAAFVTPFDITAPAPSAGSALSIPVSGNATGISTAPSGLLYVTAPNSLFEINPRTLTTTTAGAAITVSGIPLKPSFTPDGRYALSVNETPGMPHLGFIFELAEYTSRGVLRATVPNLNRLNRILVAGDGRFFAWSSETNTLYDLTLSGGLKESNLRVAIPTTRVVSFAISGENPARTMLVVTETAGVRTLWKVDPVTQALDPTSFTLPDNVGSLVQWVGLPPTIGGVALRAYNNRQDLTGGATSLPLVARVVDLQGRSVANAVVTFSAPSSVTLTATTVITNFNGLAQTYATVPTAPGVYSVRATVPGSSVELSYDLTVGGGGTGPCLENCPESALTIVSGNGQLIFEQQPAQQLLIVQTRDANGNPVGGQAVNFAVNTGSGGISCVSGGDPSEGFPAGACQSDGLLAATVTDVNGRAGVRYFAGTVSAQSWAQNQVIATSGLTSVTFWLTTVLSQRSPGQPAALPLADVLRPEPEPSGFRVIRGAAGQTIANALQIRVITADGPQQGQPIPNVALNVGNPPSLPSGRCAGGTPLTDAEGYATCNLVLGGVLNANPIQLGVNIGGVIEPLPILLQVTQGPPTQIQRLQGNNASGRAGQQFLLRARVADAAGNGAANIPGSWQVIQGSGTLTNVSTITDAQGEIQATVTLGNNPGNLAVRLTAGTSPNLLTSDFTLTVTVNIGGISAISGGGQTAVIGQPFADPLVVQVLDDANRPLSGVGVTFSVSSGLASIATPNAVTDSQGFARTNVTAGVTAGTIVIRAATGNQSTDFVLTARLPGPTIGTTSFRNAASGVAGLTPCGIAVVSGLGVATGVQGTIQANQFIGPLPYTLAGVSVEVNGIPAPIFWVSNTVQGGEQVAFQTPCEISPGPATVTVRVGGGSTSVANVPVAKYQPGIFDTVINNRRYAVLTREDGSFVSPENPARRGELLKMYVTGIGPVVPATGTNRVGTGEQISNSAVIVGVNDGGVRVARVEYLEGAIGIYAITFEVPSNTVQGPYQNLGLIVSDPGDPNAAPVYALGSFLPII